MTPRHGFTEEQPTPEPWPWKGVRVGTTYPDSRDRRESEAGND